SISRIASPFLSLRSSFRNWEFDRAHSQVGLPYGNAAKGEVCKDCNRSGHDKTTSDDGLSRWNTTACCL
ncbi:unnamed protein product, partial [Linum tenue]